MKKIKKIILAATLISILSLSTACSACGNDNNISPEDMVSTEMKSEPFIDHPSISDNSTNDMESVTTDQTIESTILNDFNSASETVNEMVTDIGNAALKAARAMQP